MNTVQLNIKPDTGKDREDSTTNEYHISMYHTTNTIKEPGPIMCNQTPEWHKTATNNYS